MPGVEEPHRNALFHGDPFPVPAAFKLRQGVFHVLQGVKRLVPVNAGALGPAVAPFRFTFLNVRRIPQHNAAQLHRGAGGINGAPEPPGGQRRQSAGMVDVGVGQQDAVDFGRGQGQRRIFEGIGPLFQSAVDQDLPAVDRKQRTRPGHFMGSAQKCQFHTAVLL